MFAPKMKYHWSINWKIHLAVKFGYVIKLMTHLRNKGMGTCSASYKILDWGIPEQMTAKHLNPLILVDAYQYLEGSFANITGYKFLVALLWSKTRWEFDSCCFRHFTKPKHTCHCGKELCTRQIKNSFDL